MKSAGSPCLLWCGRQQDLAPAAVSSAPGRLCHVGDLRAHCWEKSKKLLGPSLSQGPPVKEKRPLWARLEGLEPVTLLAPEASCYSSKILRKSECSAPLKDMAAILENTRGF